MKGMKKMYNGYESYPCPYSANTPINGWDNMYNVCRTCPYCGDAQMYNSDFSRHYDDLDIPFIDNTEDYYRADESQPEEDVDLIELKDYGPEPYVVNINEATKQNDTYRTALWTGKHLQLTLMSLNVGEDIGLEIHPNVDQFLRVEEGEGIVEMGARKDRLDFKRNVYDDFAILIPAGTWHNVTNTGDIPLKLYSIYAPPQHPRGAVHETKDDAMAAEHNHRSRK
jgi:mannose-6-phosphate isomerase-like protein (cupin superfamily)